MTHRGLEVALQHVGLKFFAMPAQLIFNTPHGPYFDDLRYQQAREGMKNLTENEDPECSPLFMSMLEEFRHDEFFFAPVANNSTATDFWNELKSWAAWGNKGTKRSTNRFLSSVTSSVQPRAHLCVGFCGSSDLDVNNVVCD